MSRRHLNRDSPDASRTGVNTRVSPAFLQDRSEVRTAGASSHRAWQMIESFPHSLFRIRRFLFATRPSQLSALEKVRGRSADRRNCLVTAPRKAHVAMRFALGARRAPYGARTPTGAPPRLLHRRTNATAQPQAALPGTRLKDGRYPSPPVPVQRASRRPVIMPAGRLPRAARERVAKPPAGTALAPLSGSHPECAPHMSEIFIS